MAIGKVFIAYPSNVREVREAIMGTVAKVKEVHPALNLHPWQANDIPGLCLVDPILDQISSAAFVVADVSAQL